MNKYDELFKNRKTQKVLGFLIAKGFLYGEGILLRPHTKISLEDILWVGENVEPRVFEVLPAALIHFPKTFIGWQKLPQPLHEIVMKIKKGEEQGANYQGILYRNMKRWAEKSLQDKRTRPVSQMRVNRTYRLRPEIIEKMKKRAKVLKKTITQYLESLVDQDF